MNVLEENPDAGDSFSPPPIKRNRRDILNIDNISSDKFVSTSFPAIKKNNEDIIRPLSMDLSNLTVTHADELDTAITKIIDNITQDDCLRLSRELQLGEVEIDDVVKLAERIGPMEVRYKLLMKWKQKNGSAANKRRLIMALLTIGKFQLVEEHFPELYNPEIKIENFHYKANLNEGSIDEKLEKIKIFLKRHYINIELPVVAWLEQKTLFLEQLYVNLIMYHKTLDGPEEVSGKNIIIEEIFLPINAEHPYRILVEAPPGFGKTTLTYKLAHDWSKNQRYLNIFKMVFIVQLRYYKGNIEEVLMNECNVEGISQEQKFDIFYRFGKNILVLLDGYDELKENEKMALSPLLKGEKFPEMTVLMTSRTGFCKLLSDTKIDFSSTGGFIGGKKMKGKSVDIWQKKIRIKGISKDNRKLFLEKYFKRDPHKLSNKLKHAMTPDIESMFECPLMLLLIAMLEEDIVEQITTITDLYKNIFNFILRRSLTRESLISEEEEIDLFQPNNKTFYFNLMFQFAEFVFKKIKSESLTFHEDDILQYFNGDGRILNMGFLTKNFLFSNHKQIEVYEPVHKTFFLSSFYLSVLIISYENRKEIFESKLNSFNEYDYFIRYELMFLKFLPGLLRGKTSILLDYYFPAIPSRSIFETPLLTMLEESKSIEEALPSILPLVPLDFQYKPNLNPIEKCIGDYGIKEKRIRYVIVDICNVELLPYFMELDVLKINISSNVRTEDKEPVREIDTKSKHIKCKNLFLYIFGINSNQWKQYADFIGNISAERVNIILNHPENAFAVLQKLSEELISGKWKNLPVSTMKLLRLEIREHSKCFPLLKHMIEEKLILDELEINTEAINDLASLKSSLTLLLSESIMYPNSKEDILFLLNRINECEEILKSLILHRCDENNEENLDNIELTILNLYIYISHFYINLITDLREKLRSFYNEAEVLKDSFDFQNELNSSDQNWLIFSSKLKTYIENILFEMSQFNNMHNIASSEIFPSDADDKVINLKLLLQTISKSQLRNFTFHNFSFPSEMFAFDFDILCDFGKKCWDKLALGKNLSLKFNSENNSKFNISHIEFNNKWSQPSNSFNPITESKLILQCENLKFLRCSDKTMYYVLSEQMIWIGWKTLEKLELIFRDDTLFDKILLTLKQFAKLNYLYIYVDDQMTSSLDPLADLIYSLHFLTAIEIDGYEWNETNIVDVSGTGSIYYRDPNSKDYIKDFLNKILRSHLDKKMYKSPSNTTDNNDYLLSTVKIHVRNLDYDFCNSVVKELIVNDVIETIDLIFMYNSEDIHSTKFDSKLCVKFLNLENKITAKFQKAK